MIRPVVAVAVFASLVGCGHSQPFDIVPPDTVGPFPTALPRRLTFNPLADITASVVGDTIAFSRVEAGREDRDRCLALLPLEGGRLIRTVCARGALADSIRDVWLTPAISPDRRRVGYVRERYVRRTGSLLSRALVVAPLDQPDSVVIRVPGAYPLPGGTVGNAFRRLVWRDDTTLRFLGGTELAGDGAVQGIVPAGVFEVSLADGTPTTPQAVPDLAGATVFAPGEDGAVYFRRQSDPAAVWRLVPGAPPVEVTRFTEIGGSALVGVADLAVAGDQALAMGTFLSPEGALATLLLRRDFAGGLQRIVTLPVEPQRLTGVPGRPRLIVEAAGDLWLVGIP